MSTPSIFDNVTAWYEEGRHHEKGRLKALVVRNPTTGCSARLDISESGFGLDHLPAAAFVEVTATHRQTCACAFGRAITKPDAALRRLLLDGARSLIKVRIDRRWLTGDGEIDVRDDPKTADIFKAAAEHLVAMLKAMGVPLPAADKVPEIVVQGEPTIQQFGSRSRWVSIWTIQGIKNEVHNFNRR